MVHPSYKSSTQTSARKVYSLGHRSSSRKRGASAPIQRSSSRRRTRALALLIIASLSLGAIASGLWYLFARSTLLAHAAIADTPTYFASPKPAPKTWDQMVYNVPQPPPLTRSPELQAIVDRIVALAKRKQLDPDKLGITLIDLKTNQSAGYQNQQLWYPASVAKLFWLVACEAELDGHLLSPDADLEADLQEMIVNSDNDAASRIVDRITHTQPDPTAGEDNATWQRQRIHIDQFFHDAGYSGLSVSQKNYPIRSIGLEMPAGREAEILDETQQPIRSLMSSDHAARLMDEIYTHKAISPERSQAMLTLLTRDLHPAVWQANPENSVATFLGESLPADVHFASKVGMTNDFRHEVALVETNDGKTTYILAVFGADPAYSGDSSFFPELSKAVFTEMAARTVPVAGNEGDR